MIPDREKALETLHKYNQSPSLRAHALAVEAMMRHFAEKYGEDENYWGCVGLLHDVDYEMFPEEHCIKAVELLKDAGYDEEFIHAVVSHGWGICSDAEPTLQMEKILFAADELTGLITACVYMRPSRSVLDLELSSAKKKFKDKKFAAGVNREVVQKGADLLGMQLDDLIWETILGMREYAEQIGLKGNL